MSASGSRWPLLSLGLWTGLLTGTAALGVHVALVSLARMTAPSPLGFEVGWLNAPLVDGVLFGALGLGLSVVAKRLGAWVSFRAAVFVLAFVAALSLLFLIPGMAEYSVVLLAAGIGVQLARVADARRARLLRLCTVTLPWLLAFSIAASAANYGAPWVADHWGRNALPPAPAGAPNVLVIVLDTVRAESLSAYGHTRPTSPWLEEFAREGVLFERAFSTSPWTLPAHGSLFTGHYPRDLSTDWESGLDATHPTLAEVFAARGYLTGGFVANYDYASTRTGLHRGFLRYDDHTGPKSIFGHTYDSRTRSSSTAGRIGTSWMRRLLDDLSHKNAPSLNREFLGWLETKGDRPVFAFLNYYDAHSPYRSPAVYDEKFKPTEPGGRGQGRLSAYEGCIAFLDDQLRDLFTRLDQADLLSNTVVVITSDHGEQFGEHGVARHGNSLYRQVLEVPLIIGYRGHIPGGVRVGDAVSIRDIPATVIDLAALRGGSAMPGQSLRRFWGSAPKGEEEPVLSEVSAAVRQPSWLNNNGPMVSVVEHQLHYIKNYGRDEEELYHLLNDPKETVNLIATPVGASWLPHFRSRVTPDALADTRREGSQSWNTR